MIQHSTLSDATRPIAGGELAVLRLLSLPLPPISIGKQDDCHIPRAAAGQASAQLHCCQKLSGPATHLHRPREGDLVISRPAVDEHR
jgi:hypothetical protein